MTDALFLIWLKDSAALRCVLMEVGVKSGGVETTRYLSSKGWASGNSDSPANTHYAPAITGGIKFTETLSLEGSASLSNGDIEINNINGVRDSWLDDIWTSRSVNIYIGDASWAKSDFRLVFSGVVSGVDSKNANSLNLKLGDKMQRLNTVVTEDKLLGSTVNKDKLIPLCFGECHNISPLLVDATVNEYQVHNGPIESIIEVRDNGVPVLFTPYLLTGKFRLTSQPAGVITCSVQGDKPSTYANDIASLIQRLAISYGQVGKKFLLAEIDATSFATFAAAHPQPVGLYLSDKANVLDCISKLASSVGGRVLVSRAGLLTIVKLSLPQSTAGTTVTATNMVERSLSLSQYPLVVAGVKLAYCRNYTVQAALQTGIPAEHAAMYKEEWLTTTLTDATAALDYITYTELPLQETLLLVASDAATEATRRLAMTSTQRKVFKYTGLPSLMLEALGNSQTIQHRRFGLTAGVTGQIISIATDWLHPHVTIEVLI